MDTDVDKLTLKELVELNHRICERIKNLTDKERFEVLQNFNVGEQVRFQSEGNAITGIVIRINRKRGKCNYRNSN
jgi:hypothetical protein